MQCKDGVVLGLQESIPCIEYERVRIDIDASLSGQVGIAALVCEEDIQEGRLGYVILVRHVGNGPGLVGIGDADGGPFIEVPASGSMLGRLFQNGYRVRIYCLIGEGADGPAVEQCTDGLVGDGSLGFDGLAALPGSTGGLN